MKKKGSAKSSVADPNQDPDPSDPYGLGLLNSDPNPDPDPSSIKPK
jgi:hypothetical protein